MSQFFKNNKQTILFALALMAGSSILWGIYLNLTIHGVVPIGFPFRFYLAWEPCPAEQTCIEFNVLNLILDLLLWYFVGAYILARRRKQ